MNLKIVLFVTLGLLLLLLVSVFYLFLGFSFNEHFFYFLLAGAFLLFSIILILWLFKNLKQEKNYNEESKIKINDLSESGKKFQKELAISEQRKNFLLDSLPQIIWETDENGKVLSFNRQWYLFTGLKTTNSLGEQWLFALHEEDRAKVEEAWGEAVRSGDNFEIEYRLKDAEGEFQWFLSRGLPMYDDDGKIAKWFGTSTNIEEQKNYHHLLEKRIKERTNLLQELNEELIRSNKELENFAYIASHDLQEPLRKIRAFGDLLKKKYTEELPSQGKEYIDRMQQASYRMQKLIDDLLNYSRVSRNEIQMEPVDLNDLLNEVVDDLEVTINNNQATIKFDNLAKVMGDRRQLKQLFQNLISNGIKFQKDNDKPVIEVNQRIVEGDSHYLELIFSDNGIGFDEKYHDKIFTIFQRLHGRIEYEGTGIGLAICKKIVENHNGSIRARSTPGEGADFIIHLPGLLEWEKSKKAKM